MVKCYLLHMVSLPPVLKICFVFLLSLSMCYVHYLLFETEQFIEEVRASSFLTVSAIIYVLVVFQFTGYFWRHKLILILVVWLVMNLSITVNFIVYASIGPPPLYVQYTQSVSLLIFTTLLLFTRDRFPNWMRLFSLACLLILIPCLVFYFAEMWTYYAYCVYLICFTPVILSFVYLKDLPAERADILDGPA